MKQIETAEEFMKRRQGILNKRKVHISAKDIGGKGKFGYKIVKETWMKQTGLPYKLFIFQRIKKVNLQGTHSYKHKIGEVDYRIGYYIVGKKGNRKDKWTWGQYCPIIPKKDFKKLVSKARKEGTLLN